MEFYCKNSYHVSRIFFIFIKQFTGTGNAGTYAGTDADYQFNIPKLSFVKLNEVTDVSLL